MKLDDVIRVPSMDECRRSVRDGEPQPSQREFGAGNPAYSIALTRWNRAFMELCPHPLDRRSVRYGFTGAPSPECLRCDGGVPRAQWTSEETARWDDYTDAWADADD